MRLYLSKNYSDCTKKGSNPFASHDRQYYNPSVRSGIREEVIAKLKSFSKEVQLAGRGRENCWMRSDTLRSRPRITQISGCVGAECVVVKVVFLNWKACDIPAITAFSQELISVKP